jgi:serine/threonine protein kinase
VRCRTSSETQYIKVNILIDDQYRPQLADFGLVRLADTSTLRFTDTGNSYTLRWASPQRLDDNVRATSDDVYSYACVSYYVRTRSVSVFMPIFMNSNRCTPASSLSTT